MSEIMSPAAVDGMRASGRLAGETLLYIEPYIKAGVTTNALDRLVAEYLQKRGAIAAPLNYKGFPKSICTSVNESICHGVPDECELQDGDIVNVDVTCILEGFHGDTSKTFLVGEVSQAAKDITACALAAMWKGIEALRPNGRTGDVGFAVNRFVTRQGFHTVKEIGGHGIGRTFHAEPFVPSFGKKNSGQWIRPWTCLTVEPMVNENSDIIKEFDIPNSEIKFYETHDKSLSAQFEHTVLITDIGYEVLTHLESVDCRSA